MEASEKQKQVAVLLGIAMTMTMHKSDLERVSKGSSDEDKMRAAEAMTTTFETGLMAAGFEIVPLDK